MGQLGRSRAFNASEGRSNVIGAPLFRLRPRPVLPRWIVTHMLTVPAFEFGDPLSILVLVETDDAARNRGLSGEAHRLESVVTCRIPEFLTQVDPAPAAVPSLPGSTVPKREVSHCKPAMRSFSFTYADAAIWYATAVPAPSLSDEPFSFPPSRDHRHGRADPARRLRT